MPGVKHSVSLLEQAGGQSCQLTTFPLKNIHGCFYSNPGQWEKKKKTTQNAKSWDPWPLLSTMACQVYLPCEAKNLHLYMKIFTRTITPTHFVYLNQVFVINKRTRSHFTLKYNIYQKSVLSNVDLWLQISPLHSSPYCIFPWAGTERTGGPFKCPCSHLT